MKSRSAASRSANGPDVVLLDGNGPELAVLHDPFQQIVYGATRAASPRSGLTGCPGDRGRTVGVDRTAPNLEARQSARDLAIRGEMKGESAHVGAPDFEEGK